ncbi:MAG TPA: hypothetical protein VII60_01770 [Acidimicrobiales bacterium]
MPLNDSVQQRTTPATPGSRVRLMNSQLSRSRTYTLVAVALVVIVITASSLATSGVPKSLATAQHHYLTDVTPVEEADVIFNGGASTPADHSMTSTRSLVQALGKEFNELNAQKWPQVAALNIDQLAAYTRDEEHLLQSLESAPSAKRSVILDKQSTLLNDIENINVSILKQLKLPSPTNVSRPVSPPKLVP